MADNQIKVEITGDTSGLKSSLESANQTISTLPNAMKEAQSAASSFGDSLSEIGKIAAGVFGGLEIENAVEKIKDAFSEAIFGTAEWAENLEHLSLITGSSVGELQQLEGAATATGGNLNRLTQFVQQLNRQFAEMAKGNGSKAVAAAMKDLALQPSDFADTAVGLEKLSAALNRIGITSQRAREDLSELGGRSSAALLPLLADLPRVAEDTRLMGIQSEEAVAKASEFQRALNTLGEAAGVTSKSIGSAFAPVGTLFAELLIEVVDRGEEIIKIVGTAVIDGLNSLGIYASAAGRIIWDAVTGRWAEIPDVWHNATSAVKDDWHATTAAIAADAKTAADKVRGAFDQIAVTPPTGGKGGTGGGFQAVGNDKAAIQQFENLRAELALEVAETGKSAAQKLALEQAFVERVRQIRGLPLKDLLEAFASEEKAWQAYLASVLKDQLDGLANSETITRAQLSLQQANDQAQMASATQAAQLRLAAGTESRLAELADQMSIDSQKVALEQKTENDQYAALRSGLEQRLAALKASGIDETEAIHKAQADLEALELTHQAKLTEIATKGATDRSKLEVQSITEQMKQLSGEIGSLLEPISRGFDQIFSGVLQGTQSASQAFRKMALDMGLALAQSGIKDLLLGGGANTIGAKLFGQTGQGGGIAGMIAAAFGGPQVTGALTNALRSAFAAASSFIGSVFKTAMSSISSVAGASGGAAGGQATNFLQQIVTGMHLLATIMQQQLVHIILMTVTATAHLAVGIAHAATAVAHMAIAAIHTILLTIISLFGAVSASPEVFGFKAASGGFVDDLSRGLPTARDGGHLGLLHPGELVLNREQTAAFMSGQREGSSSEGGSSIQGGHTFQIAYHVHSPDPKTFANLIQQHGEAISKAIHTHLVRNGGAFKSR